MSKQALGKGFEGLIPVGFDLNQVVEPGEQIKLVEISKVIANPEQPRKEFDEAALKELANSIKEHGVIQPLVVMPFKDKFRIVAGERRWRASKLAGLDKVPVIIRNHKELQELEIALVENVQRVDLSPLEQALSILRLRDQFSLTPKQIAKKLGKAETTISNTIRLLQLPEEAVKALRTNEISEGHARAILALKFSKSMQNELLKSILKNKLSVREAEQWVKDKKRQKEQNSSSINSTVHTRVNELNNRGYSVRIVSKKRGGQLLFTFKDDDELESILSRF